MGGEKIFSPDPQTKIGPDMDMFYDDGNNFSAMHESNQGPQITANLRTAPLHARMIGAVDDMEKWMLCARLITSR